MIPPHTSTMVHFEDTVWPGQTLCRKRTHEYASPRTASAFEPQQMKLVRRTSTDPAEVTCRDCRVRLVWSGKLARREPRPLLLTAEWEPTNGYVVCLTCGPGVAVLCREQRTLSKRGRALTTTHLYECQGCHTRHEHTHRSWA